MKVLCVDTTTPELSAALFVDGKIFFARKKSVKPHDETLWPVIEALLKKAGVKLEDLSAIAAASGPGRFTGIRIAMSFAAVAGSKLKKPALALSRLEGLAWRLPKGGGVAVIPAWKGERYLQRFSRGAAPKAKGAPEWLSEPLWKAREAELKAAGETVLEAEPDARDLIAPALAALARKARPRFAPLYLKPAGYEKTVR